MVRSNKILMFAFVLIFIIIGLIGLSGVKMTGFAVKVQYSYSTEKDNFYLLITEPISKAVVSTSMPSSFLVTDESGCRNYSSTGNVGTSPIYAQQSSTNKFAYSTQGQTELCIIVSKEGAGVNTIDLLVW